METYINKQVKISLPNGYYYKGTVTSQDDILLTILDKNGSKVVVNLHQIISLEVID